MSTSDRTTTRMRDLPPIAVLLVMVVGFVLLLTGIVPLQVFGGVVMIVTLFLPILLLPSRDRSAEENRPVVKERGDRGATAQGAIDQTRQAKQESDRG